MKRNSIWLLVAGLLFITNIFAGNNDKTVFKKAIETGKAKTVKTDISFIAGELNIKGSTKELTECFYGYRNEFIRPMISYHEAGKTGYLKIESESLKNRDIDDIGKKNLWNLFLNDKIQNSVAIELKAGESDINLEGFNLSRFEYRMLAGESNINLRNTSVPSVYFSMSAGEAKINLSGKWKNDLVANIKGGVGELNLYVPYNIGVRITVSGLLGEIDIPFYNKSGKTYTNDLYGKTDNTLYIDINGGIGEINVHQTE
jgi:hypothetical protein